MRIQEQKAVKEKYYTEALRYIDNAGDLIKKAQKHGNYFDDVKYVRMASGTAYLAGQTHQNLFILRAFRTGQIFYSIF